MTRRGPFDDYVLKDSPTADDVAAVLGPLRKLLCQEMNRRGVWGQGPSNWGYAGRSWREEETFNDLLSDCFASVFDGEKGKRLTRLRQYAGIQRRIAGRSGLRCETSSTNRRGRRTPSDMPCSRTFRPPWLK